MLQECYKSVTRVLQECYKSVTRVLQECYKSVTRMLHECYKVVTRLLIELIVQKPNPKWLLKHQNRPTGSKVRVTRVLQECYKSVTRMLQECYKIVTRLLIELIVQKPNPKWLIKHQNFEMVWPLNLFDGSLQIQFRQKGGSIPTL